MADIDPSQIGLPDFASLQNQVASQLGIHPGAVAPQGAALLSNTPQYETVGDIVYQKAGVDPQSGETVWKGPEGSPLSQSEIDQKKADYEKFGGIGGGVAAALTGAARGPSFGLSDVALRAMGIDAETLRKIKEINPTISTTAELGSILATLIPSGGSSALEAAGTFTRAARGAGELATKLTAEGLESSAAKTVAQKILSNAISHGVGSAAEGAFYGAGQVVSDAALGDPEALGEKALATVGLSALFGAGLGGTFSAIHDIGPSMIGKTELAGSKLNGTLSGLREKIETKVADVVAAAGHQPKEVLREAFTSPKYREAIIKPQLEIEADKAALIQDTQEFVNNVDASSKEYFQKIRPQEIQSAFESEAIDPKFVAERSNAFADDLQAKLDEIKSKPKQFTEHGSIEQVQEKLDDLKAKLDSAKNAADHFEAYQTFKQEVDPILDWQSGLDRDELSPGDRRTLNALRSVRGQAKGFLIDPENFGAAAATLDQSNRMASDLFEKEDELRRMLLRPKTVNGRTSWQVDERKIDRFLRDAELVRNRGRLKAIEDYLQAGENLTNHIKTTANGPYSVADLINSSPTMPEQLNRTEALKSGIGDRLYDFKAQSQFKHLKPQGSEGPIGKYMLHSSDIVKAYAQMERVFGKFTKSLGDSVGEFLTKSSGAISRSSVPLATKILDQTKFPVGQLAGREEPGKSKQSAYQKRLNELAEIVANPDRSATHVAKQTESFSKVAPNIGQAIQLKALNTATHLYQTAPKDPLAAQRLIPTKHDYRPSDQALARWARRVAVAENPMSIMPDLRAGTLTREQIDTLKTCYPKIYQEVTSTMISKMADLSKDVPYAKKLQLSILFGQPLDPAFQTRFIQTMQMNHQQNQMRSGMGGSGAVQPTATGLSKLNLVENRQTTMEKLQTR